MKSDRGAREDAKLAPGVATASLLRREYLNRSRGWEGGGVRRPDTELCAEVWVEKKVRKTGMPEGGGKGVG